MSAHSTHMLWAMNMVNTDRAVTEENKQIHKNFEVSAKILNAFDAMLTPTK
jgi:hypothetical protein